jgi:hypothetical protein
MTPCEPCEHGTCQYDGTCLCDGSRRLRESTYALRLTRDPFYLEKGEHVYEVHGGRRSRYVHPAYMNTYDLEDYVWELEYECPNREECNARTMDTHLPTRPNETYFRYTTPNVLEVIKGARPRSVVVLRWSPRDRVGAAARPRLDVLSFSLFPAREACRRLRFSPPRVLGFDARPRRPLDALLHF